VIRKRQQEEREKYFATVDKKILSEINKRRAKRGKGRLHKIVPPEERKPVSAFLRLEGSLINSQILELIFVS
jgi:hypothetical protein